MSHLLPHFRETNNLMGKKKLVPEFQGTDSTEREEKPSETFISLKDAIRKDPWIQILIFLTVIGAILRFYHLDFNSLWLDEAFTYNAAKGSVLEIWNTMEVGDFHPPLFHWIEHFMLAFGHSEYILRFVPAILGICTIPIFFFLGKELVDERVGVLSATLLTFSPFHIYYSQEAYSYSMVLFVFSLVLYSYLRAVRTGERRFWFLCGLLSAFAFWVHFYTLIPIFCVYLHALIVFFQERKKGFEVIKNLFYSCLTFVILISPLIPIVVQRYLSLTAKPPTYGVLGPPLISETFIRFSALSPLVTILFVILFGAGTMYLYRLKRPQFWLWTILIFLPLLFSVVISSKMTMNPRYLIFLLAVFYPGIACSYLWIKRYLPKKWIVFCFIALFVLCSTPVLISYYQDYSREDWRGLAFIINENTQPGDVVVLVPGYLEMPFTYYYNNITDETRVTGAASVGELENIVRMPHNHTIFYIVTADITAANPEGDVIEWLEKNATYAGEYFNIHVFTSP